MRGNTTLTGWPKPPPARREGSSVPFSMRCIKKPAKRDIEINERFAQRRIVRLSLSGLWFETTIALRLPCAGGGRVLAAERAMLRIACIVRNHSDGVPEATVLAAERRYCVSLVSLAASLTGRPNPPKQKRCLPSSRGQAPFFDFESSETVILDRFTIS